MNSLGQYKKTVHLGTCFLILMVQMACAHQTEKMVPKDYANLTVPEDGDERIALYHQHVFEPLDMVSQDDMDRGNVKKLAASAALLNVNIIQDGTLYHPQEYLPVLKSRGIAKDVEDPIPHARAMRSAYMWGLLSLVPTAVLSISTLVVLVEPDYDMTYKVVYPVLAAGSGYWTYASFAKKAEAEKEFTKNLDVLTKNRKKWLREWNADLAKKLVLKIEE